MFIEGINIIEVVLKEELEIPLTKEELKCLSDLDDDIREMILTLMNENDYRQEAINILLELMDNIKTLPEEKKVKFMKKLEEKVNDLTNNKQEIFKIEHFHKQK